MAKNAPKMAVSSRIAARLAKSGTPYRANDPIGHMLRMGELAELRREVEASMSQVMRSLVIDVRNDPNTIGTPGRLARMWIDEIFAGRYQPAPHATSFPNGKKLDELYTLGPINVRSACSHHLCPIIGDLWCGVIPSDMVIGISKFSRVARWILARPQIQEEAVIQLADHLEKIIKPRGLAVVIKATHSCMTWRGVRESDTTMVTNVMRGILRESPTSRAEFFQSIAAQGFAP